VKKDQEDPLILSEQACSTGIASFGAENQAGLGNFLLFRKMSESLLATLEVR
jgi:hypothetical protein